MIQSTAVGEGLVELALKGKSYNRGVCMHKLCYKALQRSLIDKLKERIAQ